MKKIFLVSLIVTVAVIQTFAQIKADKRPFTDYFNTDSCTFLTSGRNTYFILEPGYQLTLRGIEKNDTSLLIVTVLNETKRIGSVETRVVEEYESLNGKVKEVSRNYLAFCKQTGSIFYFGESVDNYKDGKISNHSGGWIAEGKNHPGIFLPGMPLLGARYYQEIAPGVAMDRAEIISITEHKDTPAGSFSHVLKTEETTPLEPGDKEFKLYAPGIGLIKDENMLLISYGFKK